MLQVLRHERPLLLLLLLLAQCIHLLLLLLMMMAAIALGWADLHVAAASPKQA